MFTPGLHIEDYELVRCASVGAMGSVYEGRHVCSGQRVAVKVLHMECCLQTEIVIRFLNEARSLEGLRHPRIIDIFTYGRLPSGPPFMVLEWLPVSLDLALSRAGGALVTRVAARVAVQIADALAVLHSRGVVHRDLKPANVLLREEDLATAQLKLADLGLAKVPRDQAVNDASLAIEPFGTFPISTGGTELLGTWDYMAPEQWIKSKDVDPKADVYALGVLLFQMLAGRLPFVAVQQKNLMVFHLFEPPPLRLLDGLTVAPMQDLIAQMLSKKPSLRPALTQVMERLAELG